MNPQKENKVNYSKPKRPAPCPERIWTLTSPTLIGLGLACVNEAFHVPLSFRAPFIFLLQTHRELERKYFGF